MLGYVCDMYCKTRNIGVMKCMCCKIVSEMFVEVTSNRTIKTVYIAKNKIISNIFPISISISNITLLTNLKSPWIYYIL